MLENSLTKLDRGPGIGFTYFPGGTTKSLKVHTVLLHGLLIGDTSYNSKAARIISSIRQEQNILHETYSIRIPLNRRTALDYLDPKSPRQD